MLYLFKKWLSRGIEWKALKNFIFWCFQLLITCVKRNGNRNKVESSSAFGIASQTTCCQQNTYIHQYLHQKLLNCKSIIVLCVEIQTNAYTYFPEEIDEKRESRHFWFFFCWVMRNHFLSIIGCYMFKGNNYGTEQCFHHS